MILYIDKERYTIDETNVIPLVQPGQIDDALTEVLRDGAQGLAAAAIEAEVEAHLATHSDLKLPDGRQRIVRHGTRPEREVQTGIGGIFASYRLAAT